MSAGKAADAIGQFNEARKTLKAMAATPGCLVSRVVQIMNDLAMVDYNLKIATDADTVRFAAPRREVIHESYEICDKLGFVQPLSVTLRRIYADGCSNVAFYQEQDGGEPDMALLRKSEQMWEETRRAVPVSFEARGFLVIVRRELMHAEDARGNREEAARWRDLALTTARGDANLLFEIAHGIRPKNSADRSIGDDACSLAACGPSPAPSMTRSPCSARPWPMVLMTPEGCAAKRCWHQSGPTPRSGRSRRRWCCRETCSCAADRRPMTGCLACDGDRAWASSPGIVARGAGGGVS